MSRHDRISMPVTFTAYGRQDRRMKFAQAARRRMLTSVHRASDTRRNLWRSRGLQRRIERIVENRTNVACSGHELHVPLTAPA